MSMEVVPVRFGVDHAIKGMFLAILVYAFFIALAFLVAEPDKFESISLCLTHFGGAIALLTFWRMGRWGRARFDSFGASLLLAGAAFRRHALLDAAGFGSRVETLFLYRTLPLPDNLLTLYLKSEFITVLGLLLVSCSWRLVVGKQVERYSLSLSIDQVPLKLSLLVYACAMASDILSRIVGIRFGPLQQISSLLFVFGVAAIYFVAMKTPGRTLRLAVSVVMGLPMAALAMGSGMKSEMFFPLIPAALIFWVQFRNVSMRAGMVVVAIGLLSLSQLYVHYVRQTTWRSGGDLDVPVIELVEGFRVALASMEKMDALDDTSARVNMTATHATTVTLADHNGFEPGNVFGMIPASFVPRLFWPNKPVLQPGAMHTARILGIDVPLTQIRSATAAGFSTELYLGGWWAGVVIGASLFGWVMAHAQRVTATRLPGFPLMAFNFIAVYSTLRFDENHIVYAYTSIVFTVIFLWMINFASRLGGIRPVRKFVRVR